MYIWRNKNRRDKRNNLLNGIKAWFDKDSNLRKEIENDIILRENNEKKHIQYFFDIVRKAIHDYLNTPNGHEEIDLVITEIELNEKKKKDLNINDDVHDFVEQRKTIIHEIFRTFDADGSNSIEIEEMRALLKQLNIKIEEEAFQELFKSLDIDGGGGIDFEEFYTWFEAESERQKQKKSRWEKAKDAILGGLYDNFKRLVLETEARNAILDYTMKRTLDNALKEFRIAHPPSFLCSHCGISFISQELLDQHTKNPQVHKEFDLKQINDERRFGFVRNVFVGTQGRQLIANRLIFSSDLGMSDIRINAARPDPYRPALLDPTFERRSQMEKGILVKGFNPSTGTRSLHRNFNLLNQYRAPGKQKSQPFLEDLLMDLVHCRDDGIDVAIAPEASSHAQVRFLWRGYAANSLQIKGEFSGWKTEELFPDARIGKCYLIKQLCPGKYRYKYVIDGVETIDSSASTVEDPKLGICNIVVVINPLVQRFLNPVARKDCILSSRSEVSEISLTSVDNGTKRAADSSPPKRMIVDVHADKDPQKLTGVKLKSIDLRNCRLCDDGAWALSSYVAFNRIIEELDLSFNSISDDGIAAIAKSLTMMSSIRVLKLNGNGFGFDGCNYLLPPICASTSISRLELCSNCLGDDSMEVVGDFVKKHVSLRQLYLNSCFIGDYGVEKIAESLLFNSSLELLSLAENRMTFRGMSKVADSLKCNSSLKSLLVNCNDLGPEGGKIFGDMLYENESLELLDLSNTQLGRKSSSMGVHALCYSMEKNRALHTLILRNNSLIDAHMMEIAVSLRNNRGLTRIDVEGNAIKKLWSQPNHHFDTREMENVPTIRTSLDYNFSVLSDPELAAKYALPEVDRQDVVDGYWTNRRKWRKVNRKNEEKRKLAEESKWELDRIKLEQSYVEDYTKEYLLTAKVFLDDPQSMDFLRVIAKYLADHYFGLVKEKPSESIFDAPKVSMQDITSSSFSSSSFAASSSPSPPLNKADDTLNSGQEGIPISSITPTTELGSRPLLTFEEALHLVSMHIIFKELECNSESLLLHPEKMELAFQYCCLPLPYKEVQGVLDQLLIPRACMVGFRRFCSFVKKNAYHISKSNRFQRLRFVADMRLHPPLDEAKTLILSNLEYVVKRKAMKEYRLLPGKAPLHLCYYCGQRFASQKELEKHELKGDLGWEHRRFHMHLMIFQAQKNVLRQAKHQFTGNFFPCFFQLLPEKQWPKDYSPQVFDKMGLEGRPIGVVELDRTIRVEDIMGDFVQIAFEGGVAWTRYRMGSSKILQMACSEIKDFSWDHLKVFDPPKYFRVRPNLPQRIELKVRYKPSMSSEICGYLKPGHIVECRAMLGDWLQIIFNKEDSVWVVCVGAADDKSVFGNNMSTLYDRIYAPSVKLSPGEGLETSEHQIIYADANFNIGTSTGDLPLREESKGRKSKKKIKKKIADPMEERVLLEVIPPAGQRCIYHHMKTSPWLPQLYESESFGNAWWKGLSPPPSHGHDDGHDKEKDSDLHNSLVDISEEQSDSYEEDVTEHWHAVFQ